MVAGLLKSHPYARKPKGIVAVYFLSMISIILTMAVYLQTPAVVLDEDASQAVRQMAAGLRELKAMRVSLGIPLDPEIDPALSGLIGLDFTDLTTTIGDLRAKQTSINPQFAGLLVRWLKQAGVNEGDLVSLNFSGSFPALNLAALCACEVLEVNSLVISSIGASTYGANIPGFTWLDMETRLFEKGLIRSRTRYASLGGILDTHGGLDETGIKLGEEAIRRHGAIYLHEGGSRDVIVDVERRMSLYTERGRPRTFINVGGHVTSLGWVIEASWLKNGLLTNTPACASPQRGTVFRMLEAGVPVIHLLNIERLAAEYHLPIGQANRAPESGPDLDTNSSRCKHLYELGAILGFWLGLSYIFVVYEQSIRR